MNETTIDYQTGEILPARPAESQEWYQALVEDCRAIVVEAEFNSRWALVEGYWTLGKRILDEHDNFERSKIYGDKIVIGLSQSLGISSRKLWYSMQFAEKFPELDKLPGGKAISWNKVVHELLPAPAEPERTEWNDLIWTVSNDEAQIIKWIMRLYNHDAPFDLDPTYSTGRIWQGLPTPRLRSDLCPQCADVTQADSRRLPFSHCALASIFFDPPFIAKDVERENGVLGIIESRFGGYKTVSDLWDFYKDSLKEFYRVLAPQGIVTFKIQDCVSGGKQHWSHIFIMQTASELGFILEDLFVLGPTPEMPPRGLQQHAKKNHNFFIVLRKMKNKT